MIVTKNGVRKRKFESLIVTARLSGLISASVAYDAGPALPFFKASLKHQLQLSGEDHLSSVRLVVVHTADGTVEDDFVKQADVYFRSCSVGGAVRRARLGIRRRTERMETPVWDLVSAVAMLIAHASAQMQIESSARRCEIER